MKYRILRTLIAVAVVLSFCALPLALVQAGTINPTSITDTPQQIQVDWTWNPANDGSVTSAVTLTSWQVNLTANNLGSNQGNVYIDISPLGAGGGSAPTGNDTGNSGSGQGGTTPNSGTVTHTLQSAPNFDFSGLSSISTITDTNQIPDSIGVYYLFTLSMSKDDAGNVFLVLNGQLVPEPATLLLLGLAAGLGLARRPRRA